MSASSTVPTAATPDVCTTAILLDGQALSGRYHVLSLTVVRELNRIPYATIHIKDGDASRQRFDASDTELFAPGRKIEIQLGYRSKNEAVFKGLVVRQGLKARRTGTLLVVECKDASVKLTHGSKSACFTDQKDSDVLEQIIGSHGLTADVEATKVAAKALVQFDSTDWDFLVCRAEANGQVRRRLRRHREREGARRAAEAAAQRRLRIHVAGVRRGDGRAGAGRVPRREGLERRRSGLVGITGRGSVGDRQRQHRCGDARRGPGGRDADPPARAARFPSPSCRRGPTRGC